MREIKFRAWDQVTETYLYSDKSPSLRQFFKELENRGIRRYETEWFIGSKDKNGKEIYDGDIIRWSVDDEEPIIHTYKVAWSGKDWRMHSIYNHSVYHDFDYPQSYKVIGNIYENPELLTRGNTIWELTCQS